MLWRLKKLEADALLLVYLVSVGSVLRLLGREPAQLLGVLYVLI
jgi:hypothetical protein